MEKKRSKLFLTAASILTFNPVIAIVSCAGGNNQTGNNDSNQTGKLSLKANDIQLKNVGDQDAQDYAKQSNDTVTYYKKLRTLIFEQRENLFQGDLTNFNANDILVSQVEVNNPEIGIGTLKLLLEVRKVNQTLLNPATIILKGFKTDVFSLKATEIKLIGQEQVDLRKINLQNFIFENKEQIFNNIPKDLTTDQIIVKDVKKRSGSLIAVIRILEKHNPQQERFHLINQIKIKLTGFKTIPAFKDEVINLTNVNTQAASAFINEANLKKLILNKANEIFVNLPPDSLTIEQILIAENSIKINGSTLKANISVKEKNNNNLLIGQETIILTGFKPAIELKTNWVKLALEKGEESLHNYVKNGIYDIAKIKNSIFKNREQIFANIPSDFNLNSFEIEIDKNSGIFAPITVKISIPEFVISGIELHLFGFFQAIGANLLLKADEISLYSYLDNKADQQEILEKMKQLIFNHAAEIFINIPDDFALNYIKINRVMSSVYLAGYLGVNFSVSRKSDTDNLFDSEIPYYVPSSGPQLLPLPFIMGGFFDNLKSAKINLNPEEKGKDQYLTGTNEAKTKMADLIFKYRSKLFVNQPENFTKDWIKILDITNDNSATNVLEVSFKLTNGNQDIFPNAVIKIDGF